jgi:hypothetical protein
MTRLVLTPIRAYPPDPRSMVAIYGSCDYRPLRYSSRKMIIFWIWVVPS